MKNAVYKVLLLSGFQIVVEERRCFLLKLFIIMLIQIILYFIVY